MRTRKILFMLISAITVLWAVPALSANSITVTSTLKAVIPNDVPKLSAVNADQNLKKGQPVETITITVDSGDWIIWNNDLPSGLTVSLTDDTKPPYTGTITGTPSGLRNGTHTYSVVASNDAGRTTQTIKLTINGSSVDKEFLTDVGTGSDHYTIFTPRCTTKYNNFTRRTEYNFN